ncbi:MAG: hypothetical protein JWN78_2497 [Bacteroidota bacterium]|nr:hypothetical protein [Bacteroidota bacterium]
MRYDDTRCANPWSFNWLVAPTPDQVVSAVRSNLEGRTIHIIDMKTKADKDAVTCEACTCPSGFHYFVLVNKEDAAKLKELKFAEVKSPQ